MRRKRFLNQPPVAPDAAVITIKGLCDADKAGKPECQTVVSKAEFEKLATTLEVPERASGSSRKLMDGCCI